MADGMLSIGQASSRSGIPVKTLRFYADENLVPPSGRSHAGYRLYSETDLAKLELVRTLREVGLGLPIIRGVLQRELRLAEVLQARLIAIDAQVRSLRHVAAALRAALREGEPTVVHLRRLTTVTQLSNEECKTTIQQFYEKVAEGIPIDRDWIARMAEWMAPDLPDEPSNEQLDAWIELSTILQDQSFIDEMRALSKRTWTPTFDSVAYQRASNAARIAATAAIARHEIPTSEHAKAIVLCFLEGSAAAEGKAVDDDYRQVFHDAFVNHDARASRVWELSALLKGQPAPANHVAEWRWLRDAIVHHVRRPSHASPRGERR